jgi:hypothetical protein
VNNCDLLFGFGTVWCEAVVHGGARIGNTHKIVTFETATRDGSLFEANVAKYGIPNVTAPNCTRDLKLSPIRSYLRSIGIPRKSRKMAVGIRSDETRRVAKNADAENIVYPLIDMVPMDKQSVLGWWEDQAFDLDMPEHWGNCKWCWKKSLNKHMNLIHEAPHIFAVPSWLEARYAYAGQHKDKSKPRTFFRGNKSTGDLFADYASLNGRIPRIVASEQSDGCGESCELFPTARES